MEPFRLSDLPDDGAGGVLFSVRPDDPEWDAAFRAWQARLQDYLVEKEFLLAELERLARIVARRVPLNAAITTGYTADVESTTYTGLADGEPATPYAKVTDLNALRVAYENLRGLTEKILDRLN